LRDENNQLKGEQGKPDIKAKQPREKSNLSSERERKTQKAMRKGLKTKKLKIDRLRISPDLLPVDAEFKGYEEVVVQDIKLTTDNVLFRKQKYYSLRGKNLLSGTTRWLRGRIWTGNQSFGD